MTRPSYWRITPDASNDQVADILLQDPAWNCFALANLMPPMRDYSQFALALQEGSKDSAVCMILRHPLIGEILSLFGRTEGLEMILPHLTLPEHPLLQAQEAHLPLLQKYYRLESTWQKMLRMSITPAAWSFLEPVSPRPIEQLTVAHLPALQKMYAQHPGSGFSVSFFSQGLYLGVSDGERILAAGGTHALVPTYGVAVLGNIMTAPDARRQGYATAITATLVTTLFRRHFSLIVLNVFEENTQAIRIYQHLGFQTSHKLLKGKAFLLR